MIVQLRKTGFANSIRGVNGSYLLNQSVEKKSIGESVRVLAGTLAPVGCIDPFREEYRIVCDQVQTCQIRLA